MGEDGRVDDDQSVDEAVDAVQMGQGSLYAVVKLLKYCSSGLRAYLLQDARLIRDSPSQGITKTNHYFKAKLCYFLHFKRI